MYMFTCLALRHINRVVQQHIARCVRDKNCEFILASVFSGHGTLGNLEQDHMRISYYQRFVFIIEADLIIVLINFHTLFDQCIDPLFYRQLNDFKYV